MPVKNVVADINLYYSQIISCLKNAESCTVPCARVRLGTRQPVWNNDSELKSIKDRAKLWLRIKQFVVTNCSKERPGSIVTKTLKNRILISIATSKESHFNADFKYISFIKFSLTNQKLRA